MMERKQETKIVKEALTKAGFTEVTATHGRGTAWGWLTVSVSVPTPTDCTCDKSNPHRYPYYCNTCRDTRQEAQTKATEIILLETGRRRNEYDGNTIVNIELIEPPQDPAPVMAPEPVPYTTRETRRAIRMAKADRANARITTRNGTPLYY